METHYKIEYAIFQACGLVYHSKRETVTTMWPREYTVVRDAEERAQGRRFVLLSSRRMTPEELRMYEIEKQHYTGSSQW